ncbi:hypothetical protein L596_004741 [Steinernema carpocapsae]|uniref:Uncharacterized protein n=1 Tax=Steinernema carpocapsae TaxID=34508 RepID=A0A4V6I8H1_STECR|nr:hypothetical protein L596_004741 [Steinernema carpocapsae]
MRSSRVALATLEYRRQSREFGEVASEGVFAGILKSFPKEFDAKGSEPIATTTASSPSTLQYTGETGLSPTLEKYKSVLGLFGDGHVLDPKPGFN